ncbi:SGNH/GDSL hydrolase family protein, partial [Clostridium disporicum]
NMVGTYSFKEINQLKEKANDIPDIFDSCNKYIGGLSFKEKLKWEIGGINGSLGTDVTIDYAIRSAFYTFNSKVEAISDKDMYCIAYNQDGTFHSRINKVNGVVTLTDVTKKYRFVVSNGSGNPVTDINLLLSFVTIKSKESFNENVLNIVNGSSPLSGKKINCLGDSITSIDYTLPTWWQQIASKTGAIFNNYGISGTCIGFNEIRETANGKCFCNRYMDMDTTADGVIVMGGTNDYEIKLGTWNDTTNETFYGALNVLLKGLLETYKGKPIIFMTPIQQANDYINNMIDPVTPIQSNSNSSVQLQLRAEAIKRKCMQYGVTCIDLYNTSGINGVDSSKIYYRSGDVTHPSEYGQRIIADNLLPILESKFKF